MNPSLGVARGDGEGGRCLGHGIHHECPVHAHAFGLALDIAPCPLQYVERVVVEEQYADLLEYAHTRIVDGLDALLVHRLGRRVDVAWLLPWQLF